MKYAKVYNPRVTFQKEQARDDQVKNNAGGYVFDVGKWEAFKRFLILGTEGGTYYVGERKLTQDAAKNTIACIKEDGQKAVELIVKISDEGRAVKNAPAVFALAIAAGDGNLKTRRAALNALPKVARTGTDLFAFVEAMENFRGWGRLAKNAVAEWFTAKNDSQLAYQVLKYQQREGWSMRDLLRLSHPKPLSATQNMLFQYVVKGELGDNPEPMIKAFEAAKTADKKTLVNLILDHNLTREMIPTQMLNEVDVWNALLEKMPLMAMVRNLGKMSNVGLLKPLSDPVKIVVDRLHNEQYIRKSRLHPMAILVALKTYAQGHGGKGSLSWSPVTPILDALNDAFYLSFGNVEPTGLKYAMGIDVSSSMSWETSRIAGTPIYARDAAACMAMVTAKVEPQTWITAFSHQLTETTLSPKMRLDDVMRYIQRLPAGGTDISLPIRVATEQKLDVDVFMILTDNETWASYIHPFQALEQYKQRMGKDAFFVDVGMVATNFTCADPRNPRMLDVVGFDTATPSAISEFVRG